MTYRYAVTYESDTQPPETIRGEADAVDLEDAIKRAVFRADKQRRGMWKPRSLSVVVEGLSVTIQKPLNVSGGA
jgi:hypothetical protein